MSGYELRQYSLPADVEEIFTAELWSLGALGFEVHDAEASRLQLDVYFPSPLPPAAAHHQLGLWQGRGVELLGTKNLDDRDWLAPYRAAAEPFDIGRGLRIDPGDPFEEDPSAEPATSDRLNLRIPAQTAFGTGSHESTRLVLEWLEDLDLTDLAVLDIGTGSGILSFAAELMGAGRVVACDIDAPSICIAHLNARLNRVEPSFFAGGVSALRHEGKFDLALVNILPENFAGEIPSIATMMKPGGHVISSGNLTKRRDELLARWRHVGFTLAAERQASEWVAFLLAYPTGTPRPS